MDSDDKALQTRETTSVAEAEGSQVSQATTTHFIGLVKEFTGLVGEKGVGAVMFAIGAALIVTVLIGGFIPNSLGGNSVVAGVIAGAALMIGGGTSRLYAKNLSIRSAHETDRLHSHERLEEFRIETHREIAKWRIQGHLGNETSKRRSDERKGESGAQSSVKNQAGPLD